MHSFPDMRRNSTYQSFVNTSIFLFALVIYNALSSIYIILPPLFGILFLYFAKLFDSKRYYSFIAFIVVLCIFEADKGFYPGMLFIVYSLVYMFLFHKVIKMFRNVNIFEIFYIPIIYISYIILSNFIAILIGNDIHTFTMMICFYVLSEILFLLAIRWILGINSL